MTSLRRVVLVCLLGVLMLADGWSVPMLHGQTAGPRPVAHAGLNQIINGIGTIVRLDGTGSSDPAGQALTYQWTIVEAPAGSTATLTGAATSMPTVVPDRKGQYRVRLVVHNGSRASNPDHVVISVRNTPPIANAGTDSTAAVGETVQLNGTASSDADGDPLVYQWNFMSRPRGSRATFADPTVAQPTFLVDKPGRYIARLVVRDGQSRAVDSVFIDVPNTPPAADAGPDQTAAVGTRVTLDGSGSADVDGDRLRYTWTLVSPAGSSARLANRRSLHPSFLVDIAGQYVVELTVNDGLVESAPDTVIISTGNSAPVANAGPDQTALVTEVVHLDGSASSDVDGDALTFTWMFVSRPASSAAVLSDPAAVNPTFEVDQRGTYQLSLTVNDGLVSSSADLVEITVGNSAPVANAGPDQSITTGDTVTLDGSASTDDDGDALTYIWSLTNVPDGSTAELTDPGAVKPTFVADLSGTYVAQLIVSDGSILSVADTVSIMTENVAPVANAGANQTASVGQLVFLDGTGSSDVDGDPLTFQWALTTRPNGSTATLTASTTAGPTFIPDLPGDYIVQLIVSDGALSSAPDTVTISTTNTVPVAHAGPDQADVPVGSTVVLDGSTSSDADGQPLTYHWSLLSKPAGSTATLDDPNAVTPTFTADAAGEYVAQLRVNDGTVDSDPDTVFIQVVGLGLPVVSIAATDPDASEVGPDPGEFTVTRSGGDLSSPLQVFFTSLGTALEGTDYASIGGAIVTIPANQLSAPLTITPIPDAFTEGDETVDLTIDANASYTIGTSDSASVTIHDATLAPVVSVTAVDSDASEVGPDNGVFRFTRTGSDSSPLTVSYNVDGTATNGTDYGAIGSTTVIPAGQTTVDLTITPIPDGAAEGSETVVVMVADTADYDPGAPGSATVTIADAVGACESGGGSLVNGATHCGSISIAEDTDSWTFTANAGERIAVHIGETADNNDFRPWIRLQAPNGTILGNTSGLAAAAIDGAVAPVTGTYLVLVASFDSGLDGTGAYRLTMTHTPGPITVTAGDEGGPLTNGALHTGAILQGDLDVWTFTANVGERIGVHVGEIVDNDDFRPWIRLWAPNGATLGSTSGLSAAAIDGAVAPVTGTYLVLVGSFDSGVDGSGTYRLTMTHTPGPVTVTAGDEGGPLTNGGPHAGEILQGDLDVWTFTATAGERIGVHVGEASDTNDFRPWIRLWAPNGTILGSTSGTDGAAIDGAVAPVTGTYLVLVATFDSGVDGTGTYRLTMTHTPGPITVTAGDEGGPLTNGALHTGEILQGDLDVWSFTANVGERIGVHVGESVDNDDFRPWIRLWAPNGTILGSTSGLDAAAIDGAVAPVTGTYLVLVATFDSGVDGTGTYRLTMTHTPGPITVTAGDQGGPLANGALHTGEILQGDLDVWTFTANVGERIGAHVGEIVDNDDFRPWIRLWAPNGAILGSTSGLSGAAIDGAVAPVTGTYLVLVGSFDSGVDGSGTYRLTMTHTPGPITVTAGDEGGPLTNGALHTGEILQGDLDVWTFTATAGARLAVHVGETSETDDFRPWIRLWAPNGAILGSTSGLDAAAIDGAVAPVTGTYLVLVGTFDSGVDGTGTYRLTMTHTPGPITVTAGDEGGPLTNGGLHTGEILQGDLDVWTFTATAGARLAVHVGETSETDDFRPWIRLWAPNGAILNSTSGLDAAAIDGAVAPVTGTYLVLVGTFDSGVDGTGTYRLTMTQTSGSITVTAGDEGGPLTNGALHTGEILQGDLDVWTITVPAGNRITVNVSETSDTDDFRPWIRLWAPNGAILNSTSGLSAAQILNAVAPVTGTYLVLVGSFDSGVDGTGTYQLTATHAAP